MRNEIWWEDTGAILNRKKIKQRETGRGRERKKGFKPIYRYIGKVLLWEVQMHTLF